MKLTLEQYISNPSQSSLFTATMREAMRSDYIKKFGQIMLREHGNIKYRLFKDEKNNRYYAYIKIPSEVVSKFYYDTIIEFFTDSDVEEAGTNLQKYYVKFFSNDPSFVYTYAHTFIVRDMFITELERKMSKEAIRESAKIKNPTDTIGYVKSIYFAYLTLHNKGLFNIDRFKSEANDIDFNYIISQVEDSDSKIKKRQEEGSKVQKNKTREKKRNANSNIEDNNSLKVKNTKTIKPNSKMGSTKNTIKTTRTIKRK